MDQPQCWRQSRVRLVLFLAVPAVLMLTLGAGVGVKADPALAASPPVSYSIWLDSVIPTNAADVDRRRVEVGTMLRVGAAGWITHLRFYKSAANRGPHTGTLWTADGRVLSRVTFPVRTGSGWISAVLAKPVAVQARTTLVASYLAPTGRYAGDQNQFSAGRTITRGALTAFRGVYSYEGRFPTKVWNDSNYYVDVRFRPKLPTASPSPSPSPTPSSTAPNGKVNCARAPHTCGYPDATNTGVPTGTTLRKTGSVAASRSGQVINGLDITGEINVTASNIVIKNSRITGGRGVGPADWVIIVRPGAENLTIQDSEVMTPTGSAQDIACVLNIGDSQPKLIRVNVHGCSAGVSSGGGLIRDSYIHDMSRVAGLSHDVGIASNGGGGMTIRHNTIFNQFGQTATIAFYQDFGTQSNDIVEDNLLAGGGYCLYGGAGEKGPTSNIKFLNNRLSDKFFPNCGYYGVLASFNESDRGNVFAGNFWDRTLKAVR